MDDIFGSTRKRKETAGGSLSLQVATVNSRTFPRHRHLDARHRNEKRKRTLSDAHREFGLEEPSDLCAGQQDSRRTASRSDEWASLRNSSRQMRREAGGLGISVEALRVWSSQINLQP